mmetsp:Transcript_50298/g.120515  ORF Transcript_50298/g.120515 Transcript_50298/m.120515 type:complete len:214 (-) Transcript_50298:655-1296(-)
MTRHIGTPRAESTQNRARRGATSLAWAEAWEAPLPGSTRTPRRCSGGATSLSRLSRARRRRSQTSCKRRRCGCTRSAWTRRRSSMSSNRSARGLLPRLRRSVRTSRMSRTKQAKCSKRSSSGSWKCRKLSSTRPRGLRRPDLCDCPRGGAIGGAIGETMTGTRVTIRDSALCGECPCTAPAMLTTPLLRRVLEACSSGSQARVLACLMEEKSH